MCTVISFGCDIGLLHSSISFLIRFRFSKNNSSPPVVNCTAGVHRDAWTAADRLYGGVQRLILVLPAWGWRGRRAAEWWPGPPTVYWDGELEPGAALEGRAEGHSALFSPLNLSVTCHTVVIDGERKAVEKREGEEVGKKRTVSCFLGFF